MYPSPKLIKTPTPKTVLQQPKLPKEKVEEIEVIARASTYTEDVVVITTTNLMVFLRENEIIGTPTNILMKSTAYVTIRHRTALPLQKIKETDNNDQEGCRERTQKNKT